MVIKIDPEYTFVVSPDFDPTVIPEGYIWDETAFKELVKATDKATADETIYTYGGPQGDTNVDYLNAADLTISDLKYNGDGQVVGTTVTANAFNNTGTVTTEGAIVFSVKSFTNSGEFNLDKNGVLTATSAIMNMAGGTINLNAGSTLQGSTIGNAGTITVVSDHATIEGAITNTGTIDALMKKLIVTGDIQNANKDDARIVRNASVIKARELEVTGNVLNYGAIGGESIPVNTMTVSGSLSTYNYLKATILTADSILNDSIQSEVEGEGSRGFIDAGEINAGSVDNVSGIIMTGTSKETGVGINVTGTINNGSAEIVVPAKINAGTNGWIKAASINNIGTDIENSLITAGKITVADIVNNGGFSTRIIENTGTITNNATGLFAVIYIDDPIVTGFVEGASINAGTIINGGTFAVYSEAALPTPVTVTSIENSGLFEFTGVGFTLTGDIFNKTEGQLDVAGTVTGGTGSITNSGTLNISNADDVSGVLTIDGAVKNAKTGTINLNTGTTLQGSTIGNAGTITVVSDHATINGAITNHGIIDATKRKLIVVGDLQNANEDDTAEARDNTVITAREFEVTGNVVNYGILGTEMQPDHQIDISGELRNYRQIEVGILTAGSIYSDGYYPEIEEKSTRGYIIAGEVNAGSIDNVSGVIQTAAPKETGVGINVTGTINNGNADGIIAKLNAGINGWIQAATLNNLGNDIENENGLIIAGRLTVGDITNNGGISTRIVESTGTITNNATGLIAVTYIDDPSVTGLVEGASLTAGTIINGGTFTISSEEALPTPINVTSFENSGTLQLLGAGMTLSGDIVNETDGLVDVAGTVTGATATITNSGTISVGNADDVAGALTVGAITGSGLIRISVEGAVKAGDPIAVTADVSGNVIDLEVTLSGLTESSYQFVSGAIGEGVTFQVNGTVYEEGVVIGGTDYALSTMGGTGLWMVQQTTPTAKPAKSDIDGNDISEVMFVWTGTEEQPGNYQHGYWMNGTDTWQSANSSHPAEWENLGCYDMSGDGKADSVLVGNVTTETTGKGAYIGYYADAIDLVDGSTWVNIGYLTNSDDVAWKNKVGNLTGNASGANSIVWYAPELYALGAWTDGTDSWVSITNDFGGDDWTLVGCGDFSGDGKDSVVMTGANGAYFYTADLDGSVASMGASNWSGWEMRAIGDFSGDGKDDVVLFHLESGSMVMCADGDLDDFKSIGQLDAEDWFVVGCGDYNGDTQDDLLVRQYSSGMLGYYSGGDTSQWNTLGYGVGMEWTVIA